MKLHTLKLNNKTAKRKHMVDRIYVSKPHIYMCMWVKNSLYFLAS